MKLRQLAIILTATASAYAVELPDESKMAPLVAALSDPQSEVRAAAAAKLKLIAAENQKVVEQAGVYWREKVAAVKPGMKKENVEKLLPPFALQSDKMRGREEASYYKSTHRLDYHWTVTVAYTNTDEVLNNPVILNRSEMDVSASAPQDFTGMWTTWFVNGQKSSETVFKNGDEDGPSILYYDNGQKIFHWTYADGKRNGHAESWHENGQKADESEYKDGKPSGKWTSWHDNGKKARVGEFKDEKQTGTWTWWYADGKMQMEKTFKDGILDGVNRAWHENGQLKIELFYKNGQKHGFESAWDENGKLHYKREYVNGEVKP